MAAATLISWANSFGDRRRAAKASSGTSIVTVAILLLLFLGNRARSSRQMDQRQASFTDHTCFRPAQTVRCSSPVSGVRYGVPGTTRPVYHPGGFERIQEGGPAAPADKLAEHIISRTTGQEPV